MSKFKLNSILVVTNITLLSILIILITTNFFQIGNKIVYVENSKLFDEFIMTKEMKRLGEKEFNFRKSNLDTLYSKLQTPTFSKEDKKLLMQQFISDKEQLEKFNQNFASEQSIKIWSRIHSYVEEFSKEKGYQMVIGSDNLRTVLFADEKTDVTSELLIYINNKYEGIK